MSIHEGDKIALSVIWGNDIDEDDTLIGNIERLDKEVTVAATQITLVKSYVR